MITAGMPPDRRELGPMLEELPGLAVALDPPSAAWHLERALIGGYDGNGRITACELG